MVEQPIAFRVVDDGVPLKECNACGAVITDTPRAKEKHREWHQNYARVAENASWGGLLRPIG